MAANFLSVWQQFLCNYRFKGSQIFIMSFLWNEKPSKIYLSLQLIITCFLVLKFRRKKAEMLIIAFKAYKGIYFLQKSNFKCLCSIVPVHKNYMVSASSFLIFRKTSLYQSICLKWNRISLTIDFFFSIYKLMPVTFYYVNKCTFVVAPGPFTFVFHLRFKMKFNTHVYINPQLFLKPKKFIFLDLNFF